MAPEIVTGFQGYLSLLDSYSELLGDLHSIRLNARAQARIGYTEAGQRGFAGGATAFGAASKLTDMSSRDAALVGLAVAGVTMAVDSWNVSERQHDAETRAVSRAEQNFQDRFSGTLERTKQSFLELAKRKRWRSSEIGWELSTPQLEAVLQMQRSNDLIGLEKEHERQRLLRPRDPYIRLGHNTLRASMYEDDPVLLAQLAQDTYRLRELVPDHETYQPDRSDSVLYAALIMSSARSAELWNGAEFGSSLTSRRALDLWNECYRGNPNDPDGTIRRHRAMAMLADGASNDASEALLELLRQLLFKADFTYEAICILSRTGEFEHALEHVKSGLKNGEIDVWEVRSNPYLEPLRKERAEQIHTLLTPRWAWSIDEGWLNDDVILINNSAFPITNIKLAASVKKDSTHRVATLTCRRIEPGASYKRTNAFPAVSGKWEHATARLTCDELTD